uniref:Retroviral polymerase SH3-like domain-containing protein n=1 Tax=Physcomitrium patens TaxID=3218 RepID=A0A2K1IR01_PHYPA|nr:hypothetical protein PHYPA_025824 [Physcomitrium patens]
MKHKSEAFEKFTLYKKFVEKQTSFKIKTLRFDHGGYNKESKACRLVNIKNQKIFISRDVFFNENLYDLKTTYLQKKNEELLLDLELFKHPTTTVRTNEQNIQHVRRMSSPPILHLQDIHVFDQHSLYSTSQNVREQLPFYIDIIDDFSKLLLSNDNKILHLKHDEAHSTLQVLKLLLSS